MRAEEFEHGLVTPGAVVTEIELDKLREEDATGDAAAARDLGIALEENGEIDEAEAAFARAGDRGDVAALAKLAILIDVHRSDPERAEAAYRRADEAGSVDGAGNVGRILKERGELHDAETAFRRCVERGSVRALADYAGLLSQRADADPEEIAAVVTRLCEVEDRAGNDVRSDSYMEAAAPLLVFSGMWERCDPGAMEAGVRAADVAGSAAGAYHLGVVLFKRRLLVEAEEALERAEERGIEKAAGIRNLARRELMLEPTGQAQRAPEEPTWDYAVRLEDLGDPAGAAAAMTEAYETNEEPVSPIAMLRRAEVMELKNDPRAEAAFERITDAAEPAIRAGAWRGVSRYLMDRGETVAGIEALRMVIETEDPEEAPRAWANLGVVHEDLGELDPACAAYESAIAHGHPKHSLRAKVNLAQVKEKQGDDEGAIAMFREVAESDHPEQAPRAGCLLGLLLHRQSRQADALEWLQAAMRSENDEWAQRASFEAGGMYLMELDDFDRAVEAFRLAERIHEPNQSLMASYLRGEAERRRGNVDEALNAYQRVLDADSDDAGFARHAAAKQVGVILLERTSYAAAREMLMLAAAAADPGESARGLCLLAACERRLGNREAARGALEHALAITDAPTDIRDLARQGLAELS